MKFILQAAALFCPFVSAGALGHNTGDYRSSTTIFTTETSFGANFTTPCAGCFPDFDTNVRVSLEIDAADAECVKYPRINGVPLAPDSAHDAAGLLSFPAVAMTGGDDHLVHASWQMSCLPDHGSLLSVVIEGIAGSPQRVTRIEKTGFSISYAQEGLWSIHRFEENMVVDVLDRRTLRDWLREIKPGGFMLSNFECLRDELKKLEEMKMEFAQLQQLYNEQERKTLRLFKKTYKQCDSFQCLVKATRKHMVSLAEMLTVHLSYPKLTSYCESPSSQAICSDTQGFTSQQALPINAYEEAWSRPRQHDVFHPYNPHPFDRPDIDDFPPQKGDLRPPLVLRPWGEHPPPYGRPGHRPSSKNHQRRLRCHLVLAIAIILTVISTAGCMYIAARTVLHYKDPRRRADWAARREDRATRRAYRQAACRHGLSKWWRGYCRLGASADYEEKRAHITVQEGDSGHALDNAIGNLRAAHQIIGELLRPRGVVGQSNNPNEPPSQSEPQRAELPATSSVRQSFETLPQYTVDPPTYDQELASDLSVVDGFIYTPSVTDGTPESSVIDCSPRISTDTVRTTSTEKTIRD